MHFPEIFWLLCLRRLLDLRLRATAFCMRFDQGHNAPISVHESCHIGLFDLVHDATFPRCCPIGFHRYEPVFTARLPGRGAAIYSSPRMRRTFSLVSEGVDYVITQHLLGFGV